MIERRSVVAGLLASLLAGTAAHASAKLTVADKVELQAAMQRHIDKNLVDGAYLHLNPRTGKVEELYPVAAHPMILKFSNYYVLCSDFRDKSGKKYNVDYYIVRRDDRYFVFQTVVDNRQLLMKFRKSIG